MAAAMSREERLERWAAALEAHEGRLVPFRDLEYFAFAVHEPLRQPNSPLTVAYRDPALRRAGLESDRFGDGVAFFDLSRSQAHRLLCSCGYIGRMQADEVARRVRRLARPRRRLDWRPANPLPALARWLAGLRPLAPARG
ncbi:MAG TPA: hypothetical protein VFA12_07525 [Stellaceae bacterium]|nr:hypothetical protein [Stellaceae bacterium]